MKLSGLNAQHPIVEAKKKHWGFHLMLDISGCNDGIENKDDLKKFIKKLVKAIDMKAVGEPIIKYLLPGDPKEGYSVLQLIETSSITFHLINKTKTAYLDVFSCKDFDQDVVVDMIKDTFGAKHIKKQFRYRDAE